MIVGKFKIVLLSTGSLVLILGVVFFLVGYFRPKSAGINVQTTPVASVYINGEMVGSSPYEATLEAGEIVIKLVPESFDKPLAPYETKVNLVTGIETIVQRDFGESDEKSSGAIVSFEKAGAREVTIAVISQPDSGQVAIDGIAKGFTPYKSSNILEGEHTIAVSAPNYQEKSLTVHTYEGYKLTSEFKLAPIGEQEEEIEETPAPEATPTGDSVTEVKIEILTTPTGYLRVRDEPNTSSDEIGRVEPGDTFTVLEDNAAAGWYKIAYVEGKEGWISKQYAKVVSSAVSPSPKPTGTP